MYINAGKNKSNAY